MAAFDEAVKTQWNQSANFWNERSCNMWDHGSRKKIIPFIKQYADKSEPLLDIGCGDGYGTLKLAEAGFQVAGVDLSNEMILLAKQRISHHNVRFEEADARSLPFGEGAFATFRQSICWNGRRIHWKFCRNGYGY
ncbi:class I SAM-dependent methyltransferase [Virgibacillus halophilus]|uniref:class I SAM-dependent methyltransferase n=1 Tax=Tigheibacillus halophilus TaxID=361280 RepID=UPI00363A3AD9